jgi:hypothetical protein
MPVPQRIATLSLFFAALLLVSATSILANADVEDLTAPTIVSAVIEPSIINTSDGPVTLTLTIHVTDDLSGVESALYRFAPDNPLAIRQSVEVSITKGCDACTGSPTDLTCAIPIPLPQYSASGRWTSRWIEAEDSLNNMASSWEKPDYSGFATFYNDTEGILDSPPKAYIPLMRN